MKRIFGAIVMCFILFAFTPAQGAITWWADYEQFQYRVDPNGGVFHYNPGSYFSPAGYSNNTVSSPTGSFTSKATGNLIEFVGHPVTPPASIQMRGEAQGSDLVNGLMVKAFAGIYPIDLTAQHGVDVSQIVSSFITRRFEVSSPGTYPLIADLTGLNGINFDSFFVNSLYQASYTVNGEVRLEAFTGLPTSPTSLGWGSGTVIHLDETTTHGEISVDLIKETPLHAAVWYQLTTVLTLTTDLVNTDWATVQGPISGDFHLGAQGAPIVLTASVPIPGSALLLFSGLGGLTMLRFRRRKGE